MILKDEALLQSFRERTVCEWCGKTFRSGLDAAHVFARGLGGGHRVDIPENVVAICRQDHTNSHAGKEPTREQLLAIAAKREGCTPEEAEAKVREIQRKDKHDLWKDGI